MDYARIYAEFIADRRAKEKDLSGYTEKHHILPRSLGGSNARNNIIRLKASDHFFAHVLLARVHHGSMWIALAFMAHGNVSSGGSTCKKSSKRTRRHYEIGRAKMAEMPHYKEFGKRLAKNPERIKRYREYVKNTDISRVVSERYKDKEYYEMWKESQKDVWTDERRKTKGIATKKLWATPSYRDNIRRDKTPGSFTSEGVKAMWQRENFREKMKLRPLSPAHTLFQKGQEGRGKKRVVCVDTGDIFDSIVAAQKWCNENRGTKGRFNVAQTCRGEQATAGGLKWAFVG